MAGKASSHPLQTARVGQWKNQTGNRHDYYIGQGQQGRYVVVKLDGHSRQLEVYLEYKLIKTIPIKGLYQQVLDFEVYLRLICQEARREWQQTRRKKALPSPGRAGYI